MPSRRTNATSLSTDELTLLDALFPYGSYFHHLRREVVWEQKLLRHDLDGPELRSVFRRWLDLGWIDLEREESKSYFRLAPPGVAVWETERKPDWRRYVTDTYRELPSGKPYVMILAHDREIAEDFWRIGSRTGRFKATDSPIRQRVLRNYSLIEWLPARDIHVLVGMLRDWNVVEPTNNKDPIERGPEAEKERTWWRFPWETSKFWTDAATEG